MTAKDEIVARGPKDIKGQIEKWAEVAKILEALDRFDKGGLSGALIAAVKHDDGVVELTNPSACPLVGGSLDESDAPRCANDGGCCGGYQGDLVLFGRRYVSCMEAD